MQRKKDCVCVCVSGGERRGWWVDGEIKGGAVDDTQEAADSDSRCVECVGAESSTAENRAGRFMSSDCFCSCVRHLFFSPDTKLVVCLWWNFDDIIIILIKGQIINERLLNDYEELVQFTAPSQVRSALMMIFLINGSFKLNFTYFTPPYWFGVWVCN